MTERDTQAEIVKPPYLIGFLSLKEGESINISRIKMSGEELGAPHTLEITKTHPQNRVDTAVLVNLETMDEARDWILSQPPASELTEERMKELFVIGINIVKMYIKLKK